MTLDEICRITGISRARAREAASGAVAAKEAARHKAIGDPARMSILRQLQRTPELSVSDLIQELGLAQPTVSHHLRILRQAGPVEATRRGTWAHYRLVPDAVRELGATLAA